MERHFLPAVPVTQLFRVRPELAFTQLSVVTTTGSDLWMNYFDMPLLASFHLLRDRSLHLLAGPQLGMLMGAKETAAGVKTNVQQQICTENWQAVIGAEWLGRSLGLQLRYAHGFSEMGKVPAYNGKTRALSLGIVARFGKG